MTEEELVALEREHVEGDCQGDEGQWHCAAFGAHGDGCVEWPCDVATLVAEVRRLQGENELLRRKLQRQRSRNRNLERDLQQTAAARRASEQRRTTGPAPIVHHQLQSTIQRARAAEAEVSRLRGLLAQNAVGSSAGAAND